MRHRPDGVRLGSVNPSHFLIAVREVNGAQRAAQIDTALVFRCRTVAKEGLDHMNIGTPRREPLPVSTPLFVLPHDVIDSDVVELDVTNLSIDFFVHTLMLLANDVFQLRVP
jgi:hypothetical protein